MRRLLGMLGLMAVTALLSGCLEDRTVVKLKKDGSGTLTKEVYMSPQITTMMEQMAAGMEQMATGMAAGIASAGDAAAKPAAAGTAKPAAPVDPLAMFKEDIKKRTAELGPDATLEGQVAKTNAKGWKGYLLTYRFTDIRKLRLTMGDKGTMGEKDSPGNAEKSETNKPPLYVVFRTTPLPALLLRQPAATQVRKEPKAKAEGEANVTMGAEAMPAAMLGPMLQGMRISFVIEVDGKITRSNSNYLQGDNRVTLLDLPMDKVLGNAQGLKLLEGDTDDPAMLKKLRDLKIDGLAIEDMERGIAIEWQ